MRPFFAILNKELRAISKERTIIIALLIQLFIASFSSALLMGLMSVYDPNSMQLSQQVSIRVGIVNESHNVTNSPFIPILQTYNVQVTPFASAQDAQTAFQQGQLDAAIILPDEAAATTEDITLYLPQSETYSTLILMILQNPLKDYENHLREQNDIHLRYQDLQGTPSTTYEFQYAVILPLLMFFPAFVAGNIVVDIICEEIANHTLETLWSAPLSLTTILGAKISAALILTGVQCTFWSLLLRANGIHIQNLLLVLLLALISAGLITTAATLFTLYFKDRERAQFVYSVFILLATSLSYFSNGSPVALMTRLAVGDLYVGLLDVALYGLLFAALLTALFTTSKKLLALVS